MNRRHRHPTRLQARALPFGVVLAVGLAGCAEPGATPAASPPQGVAPDPPPPPAADRPDLVLVTIDTLRADRTSLLGHDAPTTPSLDALGARGWVFERAIAPAPWTLPSVTSTFTGLWPREHGVTARDRRLPEGVDTVAERLQRQGYETAFFGVNAAFVTGHGLPQGFETWQPATGKSAAQLNREIATFLAARTDPRPLFLAVHYFEPHCPYAPPKATRARFGIPPGPPDPVPPEALARLGDCYVVRDDAGAPSADRRAYLARYDGEVATADRAVGDLWRMVAPLDPSLVLLADHGEAFWEHGLHGHGAHLTQEQVHVPMLFVGPGVRPARIDRTVSTLWASQALLALGAGAPLPQPDGEVFSETRYAGRDAVAVFDGAAVQQRDLQTGRSWRVDLGADPGEERRLDPQRAFAARLDAHLARQPATPAAPQDVTDAEQQALQALGYQD